MIEIEVSEDQYSGEYVCWGEPTGMVRNIPAGKYIVEKTKQNGTVFNVPNSVKHSYRNVIKSPIKVAT